MADTKSPRSMVKASSQTSFDIGPTVNRVLPGLIRWGWIIPVFLFVVAIALPWLGAAPLTIRIVAVTAIYALTISGVNLTWGYAGEFSLGQAATFAAGAYVGANVALHWTSDLFVGLFVCILAGVLLGVIIGLPGLRLSGLSFAMTTFFLVILIPTLAAVFPDFTGGQTGLSAIPPMSIFGVDIFGASFYVVTIILTGLWLAFMRGLVRSPYGRTFGVFRQSPVLAESLGIPVFREKVKAYLLGSVPASIAGFLFCHLDGFISPSSFSFSLAVALIAGSVIGGIRSIYGAIAGAAVVQIIPLLSAGFDQFSMLVFGLLLLIGSLLFKAGVAGSLDRLIARIFHARGIVRGVNTSDDQDSRDGVRDFDANVAPVRIEHVVKAFGGLKALDDVSVTIRPGTVTALIGPNGSGKTTLLNMLSGFYPIDSGSIAIGEKKLNGVSTHRLYDLGVSRTFQTPQIPEHLTVQEVVETGVWSEQPVNFLDSVIQSPRARRIQRTHRAEARRALARLQVSELANEAAADLPLGSRRLVEVARAVANLPKLLLLDEPASGLSVGETQQLSDALLELKQTPIATLLVEHNVEFVAQTADYVYVLDAGKLIAEGTPAQVMQDPAVIASYTGRPPQ